MGQPAAAQGDLVTAGDTHLVVVPPGPPAPVVLPFTGALTEGLSPDVRIGGRPAAVVGSGAHNQPPHVPPGGTFVRPPTNLATVQSGSATVRISGRFAARAGDPALTCNDPVDAPIGKIVAVGTVRIG
ncbi:MAG: PAAR domain-containing protein [Blastococcus sp.]